MFESRCGVSCNNCARKVVVNCKGCPNMDKPFWGGECKVKICCETKCLNHCGKCNNFPCEIVENMGVEQGFDPKPRLDNLRKWLEA
jgi:hypothetical protein